MWYIVGTVIQYNVQQDGKTVHKRLNISYIIPVTMIEYTMFHVHEQYNR